MTEQSSEIAAILGRVEKLERHNRWLKLAGLALAVAAGAALLMGQARASRTVTANRFVLADAQGRTRAELRIVEGNPQFWLVDARGRTRAMLAIVGGEPGLVLSSDTKNDFGIALTTSGGPQILLSTANGDLLVGNGNTSGPQLALSDAKAGSGAMLRTQGGPELLLTDTVGYETDIGVTELATPATGETHKTSAASMVLFGKDRKVLWSAPPQK
jgi:hypothetical protein